jgi:hypothetical protein
VDCEPVHEGVQVPAQFASEAQLPSAWQVKPEPQAVPVLTLSTVQAFVASSQV